MDTKKPKTPEDQRFIEVINFLLSKEIVKNERQLLVELNLSTALLYKIKTGIQSATKKHVSKLVTVYGVNRSFITEGIPPILNEVEKKSGEGVDTDNETKRLQEENLKLQTELKELKDELIWTQKKLIELSELAQNKKAPNN